MTFDTLFFLIHLPTFAGWALLVLLPRAHLTAKLVHSGLIPLLMGAVYATFLFSGVFLDQSAPDAGMADLAGVMALFSHPVGVLTGWSHFIVFDLFIGAWIARDSARLGLSHLGTLPSLVLTLVFGPLGLLLHLLRRVVLGHGWSLSEQK